MKKKKNRGKNLGTSTFMTTTICFEKCSVNLNLNDLNLCIKTEPCKTQAKVTIYSMSGFWAHKQYLTKTKQKTYFVAAVPTVTGSVFMQRFKLFLGQ